MNTTLVSNIKTHFIAKFQDEPVMIFSPGRINIIGEHTDYNDGFVFPAAVDKGIVAGLAKSCLFQMILTQNYIEAFQKLFRWNPKQNNHPKICLQSKMGHQWQFHLSFG